ncbi:hypothetical protein OIE68_00720 [Nocardia vinacea]|uniref:DUF3885 domain-containing protein n=1 Tax=Nocardia vinacea TaxID=96468 RepID=UPI002E14B26A|nr:hypothetical protein OIE68_00720 [Nocardia vinacea]
MRENDLLRRWEELWPACPPIADALKMAYPDRWVRFHSLPESKRYADSADDYAIVLDRYNTILDELFSGEDIYIITADGSETPTPARRSHTAASLHPGARYWTSVLEDPDPDAPWYWHLYVSEKPWERGCLDELLCAAADEVTVGLLITDTALQQLHHPYDGGADVILATTDERDRLRCRHAEWLSSEPSGL